MCIKIEKKTTHGGIDEETYIIIIYENKYNVCKYNGHKTKVQEANVIKEENA